MRFVRTRHQRIIAIIIGVFVALAIALIALDWHDVHRTVSQADWHFTLIAVFFTIASYFCVSFGYVLVNAVFGIRGAWGRTLWLGFVSSALNNVLAFSGAAGHSLRVAVISPRGSTSGEVLAASLFHSYLNDIMMLFLLVVGLIWVLLDHTVSGGVAISLALAAGLLVVSLVIATLMVMVGGLRSRLLRMAGALWRKITHHNIMRFLADFDHSLLHGLVALRRNRPALGLLLALMAGEWIFSAVALRFCFDAFGRAPGWGALLLGFGIGISAGNMTFVPAGIAVQEASMAAIYVGLGSTLAQALLAAILFRIVYDFIPFFLSLAYMGWFLQRRGGGTVGERT